jgi:hypothetical protein
MTLRRMTGKASSTPSASTDQSEKCAESGAILAGCSWAHLSRKISIRVPCETMPGQGTTQAAPASPKLTAQSRPEP